MALPIKRVGFGKISVKSFVLTALVIALVIALFFIPEIVDFQRSVLGGSSPASAKRISAPGENLLDSGLEGAPSGLSPLDRVSDLIHTGRVEKVSAYDLPASGHGGRDDAAVLGQGLTWAALRSKSSVGALRNTQKEALNIVASLSLDKSGSRFALMTFVNPLDVIVRGRERSLSADEALRYLYFTQEAAAQAMLREGVDSGMYNNFVALSLGPVADQQRAIRLSNQLAPFNPRLTLTEVEVRMPGQRGGGSFNENGAVFVTVKGFVIGDDVRSVQLFYNGNYLKTIKIKKSGELGQRGFLTKRMNGRGVYTFRAFDRAGQIWEKSYSFYPRAKSFSWKNGRFLIPDAEIGDTRIDRFFTYRPGRAVVQLGDDGEAFARF